MNEKIVSIIIPVYNQENLIIRALDSIPARDDIEVIVCDDCSTDNTYEVLKSYNRIPIKLFRNEINRGVGYSRNICLDACSGEYIFGLDSDDELITDKWCYIVDNFLGVYDIIRINRLLNNGAIHSGGYAMHTYFLKRSALGELRCLECTRAEDYFLVQELDKLNLSSYNSNITAYKYNYPRINSLSWLWENKKL